MDEILQKLRREADKFVFYQLKHKTKSNTQKLLMSFIANNVSTLKLSKAKSAIANKRSTKA